MEKEVLERELKSVIIEDILSDSAGTVIIFTLGVVMPLRELLNNIVPLEEVVFYALLISASLLWFKRTVRHIRCGIRSIVALSCRREE